MLNRNSVCHEWNDNVNPREHAIHCLCQLACESWKKEPSKRFWIVHFKTIIGLTI